MGHIPDDTSELDVDEIKTFYDEVYYADAKAGNTGLRGHYRRLFNKLGLRGGNAVLDVACGTGGWLRVCHAYDCHVSGVDLSDQAISVCRQDMPEGSFFAQPAETLPFDDNSFDVVTCLGSLEHFVDPSSSLREMVRVAKPGAMFVILVPNKDFLTRKLGLFAGTYQVDAREVVRSLEDWQSLFNDAGMNVEQRWRDLHVISRSWITIGPWYLWPVRLAQALSLAVWPLRWQYQVYHRCCAGKQDADAN